MQGVAQGTLSLPSLELTHASCWRPRSISCGPSWIRIGCSTASTRATAVSHASQVRCQVRSRPIYPRTADASALDVYHTYLSLAALSLGDSRDVPLHQLDAAWNVASSVAARMRIALARDGRS